MKDLFVALLFFTKHFVSSGNTWNYDDMDEWSHSFPMCDTADQSPIDIDTQSIIYDEDICTSSFEWDVDYTHNTFSITNNGHSIVLKPVEETNIDPNHDLSNTLFDADDTEYITLSLNENTIASFPNYFQPRRSHHDSFCLDSLHFHWGTSDRYGSEHKVDGNQYPLELHFVHYSCKHSSLATTLDAFQTKDNVSNAIEAGQDVHQLGVVGILFDVVQDEENAAFTALFEDLEQFQHPQEAHNDTVIVTGLYLSQLIPDDIQTAGYYAYQGSLTTPPCTNIVRWHVMKARSWIGASQMEQFRELMADVETPIAPNYREIQDNVNAVYGCMEEEHSVERTVVWIIAVVTIVSTIVLGVVSIHQNKKEQKAQLKMDTK